MKLPRERAFGWLLLIGYALTSALWAKGFVLCFEADGHVTIEVATGDCSDCCSAGGSQEGAPDGSREAPALASCACFDVALSVGSSTALKKSQTTDLQRAALALHEPSPWALHGERARLRSAELPQSHASSALTLLRSVVLRV